jgi:hypothetical protein
MRFALRYGRFSRLLLTLLASGPRRSGISIGDVDLSVAMGMSFHGRAPRAAVTSARTLPGTVISRGVHGWRGRWLVNGAGDKLVEADFDPPMKARVLGFPVKVSRLRVSVDDPDALVAALSPGGR